MQNLIQNHHGRVAQGIEQWHNEALCAGSTSALNIRYEGYFVQIILSFCA